MNYYEHHLGDYAQATSHLSFIEDAAYSRLIRKYYADEKPVPADIKRVQRLIGARTKEERNAVENVLNEFFFLIDGHWHNKRCDAELARYKDKQMKAKRSAEVRWNGAKVHTEDDAHAMRTHTEGNAHQSPVTSHQTQDINPLSVCSEVNTPLSSPEPEKHNTTRAGTLCKKLRTLGIEAAPHMVELDDMLLRFTDEQIVAVAENVKANRPNKRIHLHYLIPQLNDSPRPRSGMPRTPAPENFDLKDYGNGGKL